MIFDKMLPDIKKAATGVGASQESIDNFENWVEIYTPDWNQDWNSFRVAAGPDRELLITLLNAVAELTMTFRRELNKTLIVERKLNSFKTIKYDI